MRDFFNRLRWKLQIFMRGRNGADELGRVVMYGSFILYIIFLLFGSRFLYFLGFAGIIYTTFRMFSKNLYARREENRKFVTWLETTRVRLAQSKDYKIFKCKGCGRNIRVPRGKGKIEVTCPMCGSKTIHRT